MRSTAGSSNGSAGIDQTLGTLVCRWGEAISANSRRGQNGPGADWLHGGPGGAERPLFRYFNGDLEKRFVVVYWDQRGAGRSFDPKADPHRLTIAQHLADLDTVVDHLRQSLGQNKIVLMGHSWGAALGLLYTQAYPEKVSAFIGVNHLIATLKGQQAEYDFVCEEASRRKDDK
jgi:proline iminopeptidase